MREHEVVSVAPTPDDMRVEETSVGGVPCIAVSPLAGDAVGTIVFVHGGGYIWMTARTHLLVAAALARASGCRCVSVDYRRAPEHPYPAPVEDFVAVHCGLLAAADRPRGHRIVGRHRGRPDRERHRTPNDGEALPRRRRPAIPHCVSPLRRLRGHLT